MVLLSIRKKGTREQHEQMRREVLRDLEVTPRPKLVAIKKSGEGAPSREQVAVATSHCGAGCTLGDIVGEWIIFGTGLMIAGGELGTRLMLDFLLAWAFGAVFQYFTIVPMRGLSFGKGVWAAIRADTLSIVAFQVGMSVWAVLTYFVFFPDLTCVSTKRCSGS